VGVEIDRLFYTIGINSEGFNQAANNAEARFGQLMNTVAGLAGTLAAGFGFTNALKDIAKTANEFDHAMRGVWSITGLTEKEFKNLKNEVLSLSTQIPYTGKEIAGALYEAYSAGVKTSEGLNFLQVAARGAIAGATDLKTAVDGLTTVQNAWGISTKDLTQKLDIIFYAIEQGKMTFEEFSGFIGMVAPTAAIAGVSLEEVSAAIITLTKRGIHARNAMTYINAALTQIISPSAEAQVTAQRLGVEFSLAGLQAKGFAGFIDDLTKKTKGNVQELSGLFTSIEAQKGIFSLAGTGLNEFITNSDLMTGKIDAIVGKLQQNVENTFIQRASNELEQLSGKKVNITVDAIAGSTAGITDTAGTITANLNELAEQAGAKAPRLEKLYDDLVAIATQLGLHPEELTEAVKTISGAASQTLIPALTLARTLKSVANSAGVSMQQVIDAILDTQPEVGDLNYGAIMTALEAEAGKADTTVQNIINAVKRLNTEPTINMSRISTVMNTLAGDLDGSVADIIQDITDLNKLDISLEDAAKEIGDLQSKIAELDAGKLTSVISAFAKANTGVNFGTMMSITTFLADQTKKPIAAVIAGLKADEETQNLDYSWLLGNMEEVKTKFGLSANNIRTTLLTVDDTLGDNLSFTDIATKLADYQRDEDLKKSIETIQNKLTEVNKAGFDFSGIVNSLNNLVSQGKLTTPVNEIIRTIQAVDSAGQGMTFPAFLSALSSLAVKVGGKDEPIDKIYQRLFEISQAPESTDYKGFVTALDAVDDEFNLKAGTMKNAIDALVASVGTDKAAKLAIEFTGLTEADKRRSEDMLSFVDGLVQTAKEYGISVKDVLDKVGASFSGGIELVGYAERAAEKMKGVQQKIDQFNSTMEAAKANLGDKLQGVQGVLVDLGTAIATWASKLDESSVIALGIAGASGAIGALLIGFKALISAIGALAGGFSGLSLVMLGIGGAVAGVTVLFSIFRQQSEDAIFNVDKFRTMLASLEKLDFAGMIESLQDTINGIKEARQNTQDWQMDTNELISLVEAYNEAFDDTTDTATDLDSKIEELIAQNENLAEMIVRGADGYALQYEEIKRISDELRHQEKMQESALYKQVAEATKAITTYEGLKEEFKQKKLEIDPVIGSFEDVKKFAAEAGKLKQNIEKIWESTAPTPDKQKEIEQQLKTFTGTYKKQLDALKTMFNLAQPQKMSEYYSRTKMVGSVYEDLDLIIKTIDEKYGIVYELESKLKDMQFDVQIADIQIDYATSTLKESAKNTADFWRRNIVLEMDRGLKDGKTVEEISQSVLGMIEEANKEILSNLKTMAANGIIAAEDVQKMYGDPLTGLQIDPSSVWDTYNKTKEALEKASIDKLLSSKAKSLNAQIKTINSLSKQLEASSKVAQSTLEKGVKDYEGVLIAGSYLGDMISNYGSMLRELSELDTELEAVKAEYADAAEREDYKALEQKITALKSTLTIHAAAIDKVKVGFGSKALEEVQSVKESIESLNNDMELATDENLNAIWYKYQNLNAKFNQLRRSGAHQYADDATKEQIDLMFEQLAVLLASMKEELGSRLIKASLVLPVETISFTAEKIDTTGLLKEFNASWQTALENNPLFTQYTIDGELKVKNAQESIEGLVTEIGTAAQESAKETEITIQITPEYTFDESRLEARYKQLGGKMRTQIAGTTYVAGEDPGLDAFLYQQEQIFQNLTKERQELAANARDAALSYNKRKEFYNRLIGVYRQMEDLALEYGDKEGAMTYANLAGYEELNAELLGLQTRYNEIQAANVALDDTVKDETERERLRGEYTREAATITEQMISALIKSKTMLTDKDFGQFFPGLNIVAVKKDIESLTKSLAYYNALIGDMDMFGSLSAQVNAFDRAIAETTDIEVKRDALERFIATMKEGEAVAKQGGFEQSTLFIQGILLSKEAELEAMRTDLEKKRKTDFEQETKAMEDEYTRLIALYEQLGDNDYATEQMRQYVNYLKQRREQAAITWGYESEQVAALTGEIKELNAELAAAQVNAYAAKLKETTAIIGKYLRDGNVNAVMEEINEQIAALRTYEESIVRTTEELTIGEKIRLGIVRSLLSYYERMAKYAAQAQSDAQLRNALTQSLEEAGRGIEFLEQAGDQGKLRSYYESLISSLESLALKAVEEGTVSKQVIDEILEKIGLLKTALGEISGFDLSSALSEYSATLDKELNRASVYTDLGQKEDAASSYQGALTAAKRLQEQMIDEGLVGTQEWKNLLQDIAMLQDKIESAKEKTSKLADVQKQVSESKRLLDYYKSTGDTEKYNSSLSSLVNTLEGYQEEMIKAGEIGSEAWQLVTGELGQYKAELDATEAAEKEREKQLERQRKLLQKQADFLNTIIGSIASEFSAFGEVGSLIGSILDTMKFTVEEMEDGTSRLVSPFEDLEMLSADIGMAIASWAIQEIGKRVAEVLAAFEKINELSQKTKWDLGMSNLAQTLKDFQEFESNQAKLNELRGARVGAAIADFFTLGLLGFGKKIDEQIAEIEEKLKATAASVATAMGVGVEDLASSMESALQANTYEEFVTGFADSLEDMTKRALIRAFLASDVAQSAMQGLSEAFVAALQDGVISAEELAGIQDASGTLQELMKTIWDALEKLGYAGAGMGEEWTGASAVKASLTEDTGNRIAGLLSTINLHAAGIHMILQNASTNNGELKVEVINVQNLGGISSNEYLKALGW